jgi:seryl-tRNA synthetase
LLIFLPRRSGMELVLDSVYDGLVDEVVNLREIRKVLKERIVNAKGMHNNLEEQIAKLDKDLQHKEHSLAADVKGLDLRMRIKENAWSTASNRAIDFSNVDQQISRF